MKTVVTLRRIGAAACALALAGAMGGVLAAEPPLRESLRSTMPLARHVIVPQSRAVSLDSAIRRAQITGIEASVRIVEQVATTTLDISLKNPMPVRLEAEMVVPVPEDAVVRGFDFQGAAKEPRAELLPRDEARRIYDQIVSRSKDPALLEFVGYNLIRSSVFPVEPNGTQKVRLVYEHICPSDMGRIDYVLPRSEALDNLVPWKISVLVKSARPIGAVYSPSHKLDLKRPDRNTAVATTQEDAALDPGAFRLSYMPDGEGVTASLVAYPDPKAGGGYFLLLASVPASHNPSPPVGAEKPAVLLPRPDGPMPEAGAIRREVILVLDRSGSMQGEKLKQVRDVALRIVGGLGEGEAFNIVPYNEAVDAFAPAPVPKTPETLAAARAYIESIEARGGTNIHDALLEALRQKPTEGALPLVLFLTDGLPTIGDTSEKGIAALAAKANPHGRRVFTFGVGLDVNTPLLDRIAADTRAAATFVRPKEPVDEKVWQLFRRLNGPVLAGPELAVLGADDKPAAGRTHDLLPSRLPDLFEGDQLVLLGQYVGEQPLSFRLTGNYLGRKRTFAFSFPLDKATTRNAFVPRLWAGRKIGVLLDAIRALGADLPGAIPGARPAAPPNDPRFKELVDEVVRLSKEFGILTEYTSFLSLEGTDLTDMNRNLQVINGRLNDRAMGTRSGVHSVRQQDNIENMRDQTVLNGRNWFVDRFQNRVHVTNVQQKSDQSFFRANGQWVDARLVEQQKQVKPAKVIEFGSEEFAKLAQKLADQGRQGTIAMNGEILIKVDDEIVLVKNPDASEANAELAPAAAKMGQWAVTE